MTKLSKTVFFLAIIALVLRDAVPFQNLRPIERALKAKIITVYGTGNEQNEHGSRRRKFLGVVAGASSFLVGNAAFANDELFKPNPLTNSVLEQVSKIMCASKDVALFVLTYVFAAANLGAS